MKKYIQYIINRMTGKIKKSKDKCFCCGSKELYQYSDAEESTKVPLCLVHFNEVRDYYRSGGMESSVIGADCEDKGIIVSNRTFGAELECFVMNRMNYYVGRKLLPLDSDFSSDGSINGRNATEIRVRPMRNKVGEKYLKDMCDTLNSLHFKVNDTCGTHVHIGVPEGRDKSNKFAEERLKILFYFYVVFEPVIRSIIPKKRSVGNTYCVPLRRADTDQYTLLDNDTKKPAGVFAEKEFSVYHRKGGAYTRYFGINFQSLYEHGTLEVRYHQGTLDAEQLLHWIALHAGIVDLVMAGEITEDEIAVYAKITDTKELMENLFTILGNKISSKTVDMMMARYNKYKKSHPKGGYIIPTKPKDGKLLAIIEEEEDDYGEEDDDEDEYWI